MPEPTRDPVSEPAGDPIAEPAADPRPLRLDRLPWPQVAERLRGDPRLLLPVGTLLQHGPHLPLSTDSVIATRLAEELAWRQGVLLAPTLTYGVSSRREAGYAGTASLEQKTLRRVLNDLIGAWEQQGVQEIYLLTAHGYGPHISAIAAVVSDEARIRAIDLHSADLTHLLDDGAPEHAGEMETSLMLHYAPDLVRRDAIRDARVSREQLTELTVGEEPVPPPGSAGTVGTPSLASSEKGRRIHAHLVQLFGNRLFDAP